MAVNYLGEDRFRRDYDMVRECFMFICFENVAVSQPFLLLIPLESLFAVRVHLIMCGRLTFQCFMFSFGAIQPT